MSQLLSVSGIAKAYGPSQILSDITILLNAGDRVGLVGANGSGKSTLFRIITGEVPADDGRAASPQGIVLGYLPQQPPDPPGATIDDLMYESVGELRAIEARLRELEKTFVEPGADLDTSMAEYGDLQDRFERRGGYDLDYRIDIVSDGLRISQIPRDRLFASLSGGEKARVLLATLLLTSPDLLLLDEPTNHLDFASIAWLESYLAIQQAALLVISHDRHFLNRTATRIMELDEHTHSIREYHGNYDDYVVVRQREREQWVADYWEQQEDIRDLRRAIKTSAHQVGYGRPARDSDKARHDFKGGRVAIAVSRNVRSSEERLRRIEEDPIPKPPGELRINPMFAPDDLRSDSVIVADCITKSFDNQIILNDVSFTLGPRDRIVIVGPNGAGKSTLLDILTGMTAPDHGQVTIAQTASVGYLDQDARSLDSARTVFESYRDGLVGYEDELINDLFQNGLFRVDDLTKLVGELSSGQRRKLQLSRLIAERANVLLLDEPTNHLSFDVLEAFENALASFAGPILAVSHDRWFIDRFGATGGRLWELRDGHLIQHAEEPAHIMQLLTASSSPHSP